MVTAYQGCSSSLFIYQAVTLVLGAASPYSLQDTQSHVISSVAEVTCIHDDYAPFSYARSLTGEPFRSRLVTSVVHDSMHA